VSQPTSRATHLRSGVIGAVAGIVLAIVIVIVIDRIVAGTQNDTFWLPAGIVVGIVGGGVIGMLLSQVVAGGRESARATKAGMDAAKASSERQGDT
jgi:uncharacterized membrane protein